MSGDRCKACGRETTRAEMTLSGRLGSPYCHGCDKMPGYCRCIPLEAPEQRVHEHAWEATANTREDIAASGLRTTAMAVFCPRCVTAMWIPIGGSRTVEGKRQPQW